MNVHFEDSLSNAMSLFRENDFSQFIVYEGYVVKSLLTENGITRWLAHHVGTGAQFIPDPEKVKVKVLLGEEEYRKKNHGFVPRDHPIDKVKLEFVRNPMLEALLITEKGDARQKLLGIVTRWDILNFAE